MSVYPMYVCVCLVPAEVKRVLGCHLGPGAPGSEGNQDFVLFGLVLASSSYLLHFPLGTWHRSLKN